MGKEEIINTEFYKSLSQLSNIERGLLFVSYRNIIEDKLRVRLIEHSYMELGHLNEKNLLISYQTDSYLGPIIALMEFQPLSEINNTNQ